MKKLDNNFWNEYFRLYDILNAVHAYRNLLNTVVGEMDLGPGKVVLDAGAGTGNLAVIIAKTGADVVGLDSSSVGLEIFKNKLPKNKAILHNLEQPIPFADSTFDYICCINTIFVISLIDREKICKEFYRLLKPGGKIIMVNLLSGYKPIVIYLNHISEEIRSLGFLTAILNIFRIIRPTIKMFYYSWCIKIENSGTNNTKFFEFSEQEILLSKSGFINISKSKKLFANQAVLNSGFKV